MHFTKRTHTCDQLHLVHKGKNVTLNGWVHKIRDFGGVCFVDLRDRTGICQVVFRPSDFSQLGEIKPETCLSITGKVEERSEDAKNPRLSTGNIEVIASHYTILGSSMPLPFPVSDESQMQLVNEELRIKYRYLDLRRPSSYQKLALRAAAIKKIRSFLDAEGFLEIETPIITRSTPEGARDYLVPYRIQPGLFYALPQSPQQYKQLLMVAGVEKYYQIAKCFRDESQRSDRQPEFTQLDLEMSFVTQEDILQLSEKMILEVVNSLIDEFKLALDPVQPFTTLTYNESMKRYGCDKPDLRFGLELFDLTEALKGSGFGVFAKTIESGGLVRGVRYPSGAKLSRKEISQLEDFCKEFGAKGMAHFMVESEPHEGSYQSSRGLFVKGAIVKFFKPEELDALLEVSRAESGDLLCLIADQYNAGNNVLYRLRNKIGDLCQLKNPRELRFCWIVDFPLLEWNEDEKRWDSVHHPFTSPKIEDLHLLEKEPGHVRAECYDMVCNGFEHASGSIRIHQPEVQKRVFHLLGIDPDAQHQKFGHLLEAFQYGPPPHGGIAPGIDRLIMSLTHEENIREVIAFPKIGQGHDPLMEAPNTIDEIQWKELGLKIAEK